MGDKEDTMSKHTAKRAPIEILIIRAAQGDRVAEAELRRRGAYRTERRITPEFDL